MKEIETLLRLLRGDEICLHGVNIEFLIGIADHHHLRLNVLEYLKRCGYENCAELFQRQLRRNRKLCQDQLELMRAIMPALSKYNYQWIKGIPQSLLLYGNPYSRSHGDVDILLNEDEIMPLAKELVSDYGFSLHLVDSFENPYRHTQKAHEIVLKHQNSCLFEIKKSSSGLSAIELNNQEVTSAFLQNKSLLDINGLRIMTTSSTYTLLHMFINAYGNVFAWCSFRRACLRDVYEIYLAMRKNRIDCAALVRAANDLGVGVIVQIIMEMVNSLFGEVFPQQIISGLDLQNQRWESLKAFKSFLNYYDVSAFDNYFMPGKRSIKYMEALRQLYYEGETLEVNIQENRKWVNCFIKHEDNGYLISYDIENCYLQDKDNLFLGVWFLTNKRNAALNDGYLVFAETEITSTEDKVIVTNDPSNYIWGLELPGNTWMHTINRYRSNNGGITRYSFILPYDWITETGNETSLFSRLYVYEKQDSGHKMNIYDPYPIASGVCLLDRFEVN